MEFTNDAIDLSLIPRAEDVQLVAIERTYLKVLRLEWIISSLVVLVILSLLFFFIDRLQITWLMAVAGTAWLLLAVISYWIMDKSFSRKAYAIREKDVIYRTGWIVRRLQICPFNRIQHCSIHSGPLERQFGLASLSLFTAGSEGSDMKIPGLTESHAASLREFIMDKIRTHEPHAN